MNTLIPVRGGDIKHVKELRYVRFDERSGCWVESLDEDAQCIAADGDLYSLVGKPVVKEAPQVVFVLQDLAKFDSKDADEIRSALINFMSFVMEFYAEQH